MSCQANECSRLCHQPCINTLSCIKPPSLNRHTHKYLTPHRNLTLWLYFTCRKLLLSELRASVRSSLEEKGQRASDSGGLASFPVRVDELSKVDLAHVSRVGCLPCVSLRKKIDIWQSRIIESELCYAASKMNAIGTFPSCPGCQAESGPALGSGPGGDVGGTSATCPVPRVGRRYHGQRGEAMLSRSHHRIICHGNLIRSNVPNYAFVSFIYAPNKFPHNIHPWILKRLLFYPNRSGQRTWCCSLGERWLRPRSS